MVDYNLWKEYLYWTSIIQKKTTEHIEYLNLDLNLFL